MTVVVLGYDEVHTLYYSGAISRKFITPLAEKELAEALKEKQKHVHVTHIMKETQAKELGDG